MSEHAWSAAREREYLRDVVRACSRPGEWNNFIRARHGSSTGFLRNYIDSLESRYYSWDSWEGQRVPMLESERHLMREFALQLLAFEVEQSMKVRLDEVDRVFGSPAVATSLESNVQQPIPIEEGENEL